MCSHRCKNHGCGQKKPKSTSSAIFGVKTVAKSCELKWCADRVSNRTDKVNLNFSPELYRLIFLPKLNFSPSTKKTTEYSFELFFPLTNLFLTFVVFACFATMRVISSVCNFILVILWCRRTDGTINSEAHALACQRSTIAKEIW